MRVPYAIIVCLLTFAAGGLLAASAVFGVLSQRRIGAVAASDAAPRPVVVLVARGKITQWSTIRSPEEQFETRETLSTEVPANFIAADNLDALKGRRTRSTIAMGTILTEDHLLKREVTGIDGMLDRGKRAIAVPITADKAVSYFVTPGSKVDVIHTVNGVATVVVENVLVLAVDDVTARPHDKVGVEGSTATLQMDSVDQVLKVSAALERGTIRLVLRPLGDDGVHGGDDRGPAPPPPVPPPPPVFEEPLKEKKIAVERNKFAACIPVKLELAALMVRPGNRIDIAHSDKGTTRVLLSNALVLGIELPDLKDDKQPDSDIWLSVQLDDHGQVLKLVQARRNGSLSVAPREEKKRADD